MSRIDPGQVPVGADGKPVAKPPGSARCPLDSRERLLQKLGTRWIRAHGPNRDPRYRKSDAERADTLADVVAQADGPLPEYGHGVWYEGVGPILRPLDEEAQAAVDAGMDRADGQYGPAQIAELRESADAILAGANVFTHHVRPDAVEERDVAIEVAGRLAS